MMVLDVKGMKSTEASENPADRYREDRKPPSRTPQKIAAILAGAGAYLVSLLTGRADAAPAPEAAAAEEASPRVTPEDFPAPRPDASGEAAFWSLGEEWGSLLASSRAEPVEEGPHPLPFVTVLDVTSGPPYAQTLAGVLSPAAANDARVVLPVVSGSGGGLGLQMPPPSSGPAVAPPPEAPAPETPSAGPGAGGEPPAGRDDAAARGRNRAPQSNGPVVLSDLSGCGAVLIGLSDLLAQATDPDGDSLIVRDVAASSGTMTISEEGWLFAPGREGPGPVALTYLISDGEFSVPQVAHFNVTAAPAIVGTAADDLLVGTACSERIQGRDGNDNIVGRGGNDAVEGGRGDDHIVLGRGNDTIFGGAGDDIILAGAGGDLIWGGAGDDRLHGEAGDDTIFGDAGDDTLDGGTGDDLLLGGNGDDTILDGAGRDVVRGGRGSDLIRAAADRKDDVYNGGAGRDVIDYSAASDAIRLDLIAGTATGADIGTDTITGFEEAIGGGGDDHFVVGAAPVVLTGNGGNNIFEFLLPEDDLEALPGPGHEIRDLRCGDTIRLGEIDLFKDIVGKVEDMFEKTYGDLDDDQLMIRVRHDQFEDIRRTVIEADLNGDSQFEMVVFVDGLHVLKIDDHAA